MTYSHRACSLLSLAILLAVPACAGGDAPSTSTVVAANGGGTTDDEYIGHQGTLLLGFRDPDVRTFLLPTSVIGARVLDDGQLVASGLSGRQFVGMSITASGDGQSIKMRIADVVPPAEIGDKWQYALEQWEPLIMRWLPACAEPQLIVPPSDPQPSPPLAIAMPGWWTRDGLYNVNTGAISFACRTGVVAKCDRFGFPVTADPPNVTENGLATTVTGPDMMQACTRMLRADYCAQGIANTLNGTPIHVDDIFRTPPPVTGYAFEGAWPGVAVVARTAPRPPVICLSKLRWSTLPLGGTCPLQIPDPRVDPKGTFCDDLGFAALESKGALVYSGSTYLDAGLYTYSDASTGTRLTTSNLVPQAAGHPPEWLISPAPQVGFPIAGQLPVFEATVFAASLPPGINATDLHKLGSYQCPSGDLVTTTTETSDPACPMIASEGYVYAPNAPGRAQLRRWWNPTTQRSYTTPAAPSTMIASGWQLAGVIGGVVRAAIDVNVRWSRVSGATYALAVQSRTGEWISPCIDATQIGSATSLVYRGVCTSASMRTVNHADIKAFRITATTINASQVATAAYDGVDSDAYVPISGGTTTAVAVAWNDVGPGFTYSVDVRDSNGDLIACAYDDVLANSLSYVHTGFCPKSGVTVKVPTIQQFRVCALWNHDPTTASCVEASYNGTSPRIDIELPATM